jgi:hypothetical protein
VGTRKKISASLLTEPLGRNKRVDVSPAAFGEGWRRTKEASHRYTTDERTPERVGSRISAHTELGGLNSTFRVDPPEDPISFDRSNDRIGFRPVQAETAARHADEVRCGGLLFFCPSPLDLCREAQRSVIDRFARNDESLVSRQAASSIKLTIRMVNRTIFMS